VTGPREFSFLTIFYLFDIIFFWFSRSNFKKKKLMAFFLLPAFSLFVQSVFFSGFCVYRKMLAEVAPVPANIEEQTKTLSFYDLYEFCYIIRFCFA
jgi:hypothetical protein